MSNNSRENYLFTNQVPGELIYTGEYINQSVRLELIVYDKEKFEFKEIKGIDEIPSTSSVIWLNVIGLHNIELIKEIGLKYSIDKMLLEDIVNIKQRSKIEPHKEYLFSVFKMVYMKGKNIIHEHISMLVFKNMIITFQECEGDVFDTIRNRIRNNAGIIRNRKVDYLYYSVIDALTDQYFEILGVVSSKIDDIEEQVIEEKEVPLELIYSLKKEILLLKSAVFPIKDILISFLANDMEYISDEVTKYFKDVEDHLKHVAETIVTYREMVMSLSETQMSNISNRMNKVMTTLTFFSIIFIPLSFLTGVFGMNFIYMPGLTNQQAFIYFCIACIIISGGMVSFFKINKWF
ncbi:magnesium/cobalt transporter CorA [Clostridium sp. DL1XJH146]